MPRLPVLWLLLASPLQAQVPELPGAGRPVDIEATRARRERLLTRLQSALVVIPAAPVRDLESEVLQDSDFRQDDYFFYLTGLETADAWLVLVAGPDSTETILFLPERVPAQERWTGLRLGPGPDAVRLTGIARVLPVDGLEAELSGLRRRGAGPLYLPLYHANARVDRLRDWMFEGRDVRNVVPALDSLRLVKDDAELARMRKAIAITTDAIRAAMQAVRPGMFEYQLEATIEYHFRNAGADRVGFPSIIGSGPNSTTFHYDVSRRQMRDGELVVTDVGAEWGQYSADVTRTFPVNGRFSARQKQIYDLVLATQQAVLDSVRPGTTIRALTRLARETMKAKSGALCGEQTCDAYFSHGLSHWLGMRVHDVGDYGTPLAPGMVLTIEPGIYLPAESLGVRIEDDILVTGSGWELLSGGAPRTTVEIEALMRPRRQTER